MRIRKGRAREKRHDGTSGRQGMVTLKQHLAESGGRACAAVQGLHGDGRGVSTPTRCIFALSLVDGRDPGV